MKSKFCVTMLLIAAILSFPACKEDVSGLLNSPVYEFENEFQTGQSGELSGFLKDIFDGRIASFEYIERWNISSDDFPGHPDSLVQIALRCRFSVMDELSKPGEVWLVEEWAAVMRTGDIYRGYMPTRMYKLENHPEVPSAITVQWYTPSKDGLTNEIVGWSEEPAARFIQTEINGIVYEFYTPIQGYGGYSLRCVWAQLPGTTDRMFTSRNSSVSGYASESLLDLMQTVSKEVTIDVIQNWADHYVGTLLKEHNEFKITRK